MEPYVLFVVDPVRLRHHTLLSLFYYVPLDAGIFKCLFHDTPEGQQTLENCFHLTLSLYTPLKEQGNFLFILHLAIQPGRGKSFW